jgi:hypothetical protein
MNPNLTCLILLFALSINVSLFVLGKLYRLTVLQECRSEFCCITDKVIEMGKRCRLLKLIDITSSVFVDYLLDLEILEKLRVGGTKIFKVCYALFRPLLLRIQRIHWCGIVEVILQNIAMTLLPFSNILTDESISTYQKLNICL